MTTTHQMHLPEHAIKLIASFRQMRAEQPVHYHEPSGTWHVYRYADVQRVLSDHLTFSNDIADRVPLPFGLDVFVPGNFSWMDPPRHRELRRLLSQAFSTRMIAGLAPKIATVTGDLLDQVDGDGFDLVRSLAYPLPVTVIADLLGVPNTDRVLFARWADILLNGPASHAAAEPAPDLNEMRSYFLEHIRRSRRNHDDNLIGKLTEAEVDGMRLTDDQIVGFAGLLLISGHITTTMTMGNTVLCLDAHPDALAAIRADHERIPAMMEELWRFQPPVLSTARLIKRDTVLGGHEIPAGTFVTAWILSGNRDERQFADPDRFDIERSPNAHLGFGHGIHFCLGAPLARLEATIAIRQLLNRFPKLRVNRDIPPVFHRSMAILGPTSLAVTESAS